MKKTIILKENQLRQVVSETVRKILNEGNKYTQLINILGSDVDDEWNVAADAERKEELESEIWRAISNLASGNPRKNTFDFTEAANMLDKNFGFKYVGCDEENETHCFENGKDKLELFPSVFYPRQGKMRLDNMHVY